MPEPFTIVIPARYASIRLPGKPLLDIAGKPMIQWVYQQARQTGARRVVVATDDSRISDVVASFDGEVLMTSADHPSGTDRLQEVARHYGLEDDAILVNVQGDEPLIPADVSARPQPVPPPGGGCRHSQRGDHRRSGFPQPGYRQGGIGLQRSRPLFQSRTGALAPGPLPAGHGGPAPGVSAPASSGHLCLPGR